MMPSWNSSSNGTDDFTRCKMGALYAACDPDKLSEVECLLTKYRGREDRLWSSLERKYGVSAVAAAHKAAEEEDASAPDLFGGLLSQMALPDSIIPESIIPSGQDEAAFSKRKMTALYEAHNQSKVGEVDVLLAKYKGKEADMWAKLESKYGVEAIVEASLQAADTDTRGESFRRGSDMFSEGLAFFGNGATVILQSANDSGSGMFSALESAARRVTGLAGSLVATDARCASSLPHVREEEKVHDAGDLLAAAKEKQYPTRRPSLRRQASL
jgi:hypothetical protein